MRQNSLAHFYFWGFAEIYKDLLNMYFAPRNRLHLRDQIVTDSTKTLDEIDFRRDKESLVFQQSGM